MLSFDDSKFDGMLAKFFEDKYGISNAFNNGRLTDNAIQQLENFELSSSLIPIGKSGYIFYDRNILSRYLVNDWLSPYPIFSDNDAYQFSEEIDEFDVALTFLSKYNYIGNVPLSMVAGDILRLTALFNILLDILTKIMRFQELITMLSVN